MAYRPVSFFALDDRGKPSLVFTCRFCDAEFLACKHKICPKCMAVCGYLGDAADMSLWSRLTAQVRHGGPWLLGEGGFGMVFKGAVRLPQKLQDLRGSTDPSPPLITENCVIKIPRSFKPYIIFDHASRWFVSHGVRVGTDKTILITKTGLTRGQLKEMQQDFQYAIDDFQHEVDITHTLMYSAKHTHDLRETHPRPVILDVDAMQVSFPVFGVQ